jgi:hypothetical protein
MNISGEAYMMMGPYRPTFKFSIYKHNKLEKGYIFNQLAEYHQIKCILYAIEKYDPIKYKKKNLKETGLCNWCRAWEAENPRLIDEAAIEYAYLNDDGEFKKFNPLYAAKLKERLKYNRL